MHDIDVSIPLQFDPRPFEDFHRRRALQFGDVAVSPDTSGLLERLRESSADLEGLTHYAETCAVPGVSATDYGPRIVRLTEDCSVIAQIHFRGLVVGFPFVDITVQSAALPEALATIVREFRVFAPRAIRIWRTEADAAPRNGRDDQYVVLGPLPTLSRTPALPKSSRIRLQPDANVESYHEYCRTYEALVSADSTLQTYTRPEDESSLRACANAGAFFRVLIDGRCAGFIAARPGRFRAWCGWMMVDKVLHPSFRRKGFGPAVEQVFLRSLDAGQGSIVFGTIDAANAPSLKTALGVGRRVAEIGTFIPLDSV